MGNWADWALRVFALYGVVHFTYQVGKFGLKSVMEEFATWFSVAKKDFLDLKGYVLVLENRIIALEQHPALSIPPVTSGVKQPPASA